jgi:hypothetical protein
MRIGGKMPALQSHIVQPQTRGRESRTQSIATRFTPSEVQTMQKRAEANGQNLREWARDALLRNEDSEHRAEMEMHIFTELVGLQMLLMSTLEPLLRGSTLNQEQINAIFRQVQTTQAAKAQELLAKRGQKQEK